MTHAEAIAAIKANWPTENYTMLREALTLACAALASPPAEDENRAKLAEVIRDVAQRLESCGVMGRDLHLRTCSGDEDTPCNCGADDPAEVLRGVADALIWPTAAQAPPASDPPGLVASLREQVRQWRDRASGIDDDNSYHFNSERHARANQMDECADEIEELLPASPQAKED